MRKELIYTPHLLLQRIAEIATSKFRLRRLKHTCASWLVDGHIDSMELIEIASGNGAQVFYDIGANVGSWSLLCRALAKNSKIVAFEPLSDHCAQFEKNLKGQSDVRLCRVGLGPHDETRPILVTSFSDATSFLPLNQNGAKLWNIENTQKIEVPVVMLDTYIVKEGLPKPDFLKLDVQGFELAVLQGAIATLKGVEWVLSEVSFRRFYDNQVLFCELAAFMATQGFEVHAFGHSLRCDQPQNQVDVLFRRIKNT